MFGDSVYLWVSPKIPLLVYSKNVIPPLWKSQALFFFQAHALNTAIFHVSSCILLMHLTLFFNYGQDRVISKKSLICPCICLSLVILIGVIITTTSAACS